LVRGAVAATASWRAGGILLAKEAAVGDDWTVPYDLMKALGKDRVNETDIVMTGGWRSVSR
jgi:hypothetical protein